MKSIDFKELDTWGHNLRLKHTAHVATHGNHRLFVFFGCDLRSPGLVFLKEWVHGPAASVSPGLLKMQDSQGPSSDLGTRMGWGVGGAGPLYFDIPCGWLVRSLHLRSNACRGNRDCWTTGHLCLPSEHLVRVCYVLGKPGDIHL